MPCKNFVFRTSHVHGDIFVNGEIRNMKSFRKTSCYIMQVIMRNNLQIISSNKLDSFFYA